MQETAFCQQMSWKSFACNQMEDALKFTLCKNKIHGLDNTDEMKENVLEEDDLLEWGSLQAAK